MEKNKLLAAVAVFAMVFAVFALVPTTDGAENDGYELADYTTGGNVKAINGDYDKRQTFEDEALALYVFKGDINFKDTSTAAEEADYTVGAGVRIVIEGDLVLHKGAIFQMNTGANIEILGSITVMPGATLGVADGTSTIDNVGITVLGGSIVVKDGAKLIGEGATSGGNTPIEILNYGEKAGSVIVGDSTGVSFKADDIKVTSLQDVDFVIAPGTTLTIKAFMAFEDNLITIRSNASTETDSVGSEMTVGVGIGGTLDKTVEADALSSLTFSAKAIDPVECFKEDLDTCELVPVTVKKYQMTVSGTLANTDKLTTADEVQVYYKTYSGGVTEDNKGDVIVGTDLAGLTVTKGDIVAGGNVVISAPLTMADCIEVDTNTNTNTLTVGEDSILTVDAASTVDVASVNTTATGAKIVAGKGTIAFKASTLSAVSSLDLVGATWLSGDVYDPLVTLGHMTDAYAAMTPDRAFEMALNGEYTIDANASGEYVIGKGMKLTIPSGAEITIPENISMDVTADALDVQGELEVIGELTVTSETEKTISDVTSAYQKATEEAPYIYTYMGLLKAFETVDEVPLSSSVVVGVNDTLVIPAKKTVITKNDATITVNGLLKVLGTLKESETQQDEPSGQPDQQDLAGQISTEGDGMVVVEGDGYISLKAAPTFGYTGAYNANAADMSIRPLAYFIAKQSTLVGGDAITVTGDQTIPGMKLGAEGQEWNALKFAEGRFTFTGDVELYNFTVTFEDTTEEIDGRFIVRNTDRTDVVSVEDIAGDFVIVSTVSNDKDKTNTIAISGTPNNAEAILGSTDLDGNIAISGTVEVDDTFTAGIKTLDIPAGSVLKFDGVTVTLPTDMTLEGKIEVGTTGQTETTTLDGTTLTLNGGEIAMAGVTGDNSVATTMTIEKFIVIDGKITNEGGTYAIDTNGIVQVMAGAEGSFPAELFKEENFKMYYGGELVATAYVTDSTELSTFDFTLVDDSVELKGWHYNATGPSNVDTNYVDLIDEENDDTKFITDERAAGNAYTACVKKDIYEVVVSVDNGEIGAVNLVAEDGTVTELVKDASNPRKFSTDANIVAGEYTVQIPSLKGFSIAVNDGDYSEDVTIGIYGQVDEFTIEVDSEGNVPSGGDAPVVPANPAENVSVGFNNDGKNLTINLIALDGGYIDTTITVYYGFINAEEQQDMLSYDITILKKDVGYCSYTIDLEETTGVDTIYGVMLMIDGKMTPIMNWM